MSMGADFWLIQLAVISFRDDRTAARGRAACVGDIGVCRDLPTSNPRILASGRGIHHANTACNDGHSSPLFSALKRS